MAIHRLNHAVLYVRDASVAAEFYRQVLGFSTVASMPGAVFLRAERSTNDHDLGLFEMGPSAGPPTAGRSTVGLYHLAWEVDTLEDLERIGAELSRLGALVGASDHGTTKALYARDPDGLEFEVSWLVPAAMVDGAGPAAGPPRPLDLEEEKRRYGALTPGGVGVSRPDGWPPA